MDYVKKVNNLCLTGDLSENWRRFKQSYDIFEEAAGIRYQTENKRIASFLNTIGEDALELFNGFDLSDKDRKSYTKIRKAFEVHCTTRRRIVVERFKFFSHRQSDSDSMKSYLNDLTKMAATCEFKEQEELLIRDQFLLGLHNKGLQEDLLLFEDNLTVDKIAELLDLLSVSIQKTAPETDDIIVVGETEPTNQGPAENGAPEPKDEGKPKPPSQNNAKDACKRCGFRHPYGVCPAFGKKCLKCYQSNHFAVCCTVRTEDYKHPCKKCNQKHAFRNCPAFGKNCTRCFQINHFAVNCTARKVDK